MRWLAGDASMRRYARLSGPAGRTAVAVKYPGGTEGQLARDLAVRLWLETRGLRVPRLLHDASSDGWALLEDFGDHDAAAVLAQLPCDERPATIARLLDPLEVLSQLDPADLPPWSLPLDRERLRWELAGFELWYLRARCGVEPSAVVTHWLDRLAADCAALPRRVCHRDYHLNNLYLLDDGSVGLIDFQDLLVGPEAYDLVSLLGERDALRLVPAAQVLEAVSLWRERTRAGTPDDTGVVQVATQRRLKVLGTFARLDAAGRCGYQDWLRGLEAPTGHAVAALGGPQQLADLLLHSDRQGGPHVR